jgi:phage FluMu protein Com
VQRALRILPRHLTKTVSFSQRRCWNCNHRLCDVDIRDGVVGIKCENTKCKQINFIIGIENKGDQ